MKILVSIFMISCYIFMVSSADIRVVESIPLGLDLHPFQSHSSIYEGCVNLIRSANDSIEIAAMYFTLTQGLQYPQYAGGYMGLDIFHALINAKQRGVNVRLVQSYPPVDPDAEHDIKLFLEAGIAVRNVDWSKLNNGQGILHTKFMVVDKQSLYLGSANWDWRSFAQVKEIGIIMNSDIMANDLSKIFDLYWFVAGLSNLPPVYPPTMDTSFNISNPEKMEINGNLASLFFAASPPPFNTPHRTDDITALVSVIHNSNFTVYASVMDYSPFTIYTTPSTSFYWPALDDAFRDAAFRGVKVNLLFSLWDYTDNRTLQYMKSLNSLDGITVKLMVIPPFSGVTVPYTRVNHAKYLVSEKQAYITTSNWTPDYFLFTGGVSVTISDEPVRARVEDIFLRDWQSPYAHDLNSIIH